MELTWPLGTSRRRLPREKFARKLNNIFFIVQTFSPAMAGYWPCSSFACLWTSNLCCSINTQKQNLANIQQSCPHAWSISHISIVKQPNCASITPGTRNIAEYPGTSNIYNNQGFSCIFDFRVSSVWNNPACKLRVFFFFSIFVENTL